MKVLIAVISYSGDAENGAHQAIRDTWGKDAGAPDAHMDLRFFIGRRRKGFVPKSDEIMINDTYTQGDFPDNEYIQRVIRGMLQWSIQQDYDFTFLCCNDTFIIPRKLAASGFEKYDYSGFFVPRDIPLGTKSEEKIYGASLYLWADAGVGWFMSRFAADVMTSTEYDSWPGDIWIGQRLGPLIAKGVMRAGNLPNFWNETSWHYRFVHDDRGYYPDSKWQYKMYALHGQES